MLESICPNDASIYVWKVVGDRIESALAEFLKTDTVYFYYDGCPETGRGKNDCTHLHHNVWVGNVGVVEAMRQMMLATSIGTFVSPFATSASCLENIVDEETVGEDIEREIWGPDGRIFENWDAQWEDMPDGSCRMKPQPPDEREKTRAYLRRLAEMDNTYWIGDIGRESQVHAADSLWAWLWNDIRDTIHVRRKVWKSAHWWVRWRLTRRKTIPWDEFMKTWENGKINEWLALCQTGNDDIYHPSLP